MIVVLKPQTTQDKIDHLVGWLNNQGIQIHLSVGSEYTIIGLIGNTDKVDVELLESLDMVMAVRRVGEPFKQCSRMFHPEDTVITVGNAKIGGGNFCMIAGPCSVESEAQILEVAQKVKASGAHILRGGAFKPRTSPYAFQGLRAEGLTLLSEAKRVTGLPLISEIMNVNHLPLFEDVDIIQVGARNMQNFDLLQELGHINKPILLKRGLANTLKELLMSAEYIMAGGNEQVILCERGIRTFETYTRNTLDLSAVPKLHEISHLPVVVDPSHATGEVKLVPSMALAAAACGADGLMVEVHNDPAHARCDGAQSLTPEQFNKLAAQVRAVLEVIRS
ncbi:MAG: 3-deoxy-7-phosphoheptulonate synthase [Ruminococcaceae bacterium]|nr:3-deoxy-7-phosphoheptulonate synthase [Oscillospiraceae bacterium]